MLVNVLGGDGSGKTTQLELLKKWIHDQTAFSVRLLSKKSLFDTDTYPECDFFGVTYEILAHELLPIMKGQCRALWLYYMNMVLAKSYTPNTQEIVLLDGYWQKHYATEAALGIDPDWLITMGSAFPVPDLTIVMDIDPRTVVERGHEHKPYESGCDFTCSDEVFILHQDKVRHHILALANKHHYQVINADNDADVIQRELINSIESASNISLQQS